LGGFTPQVDSEAAIEMLLKAIEKAGHTDNCKIAVDMAASQWSVKSVEEEEAEEAAAKAAAAKENGEGSETEETETETETATATAAAAAEEDDDDEDEDGPEVIKEYNLDTFKREGGGMIKDSDDLLDMYREWLAKYPLLVSIEDPFDRKDGDFFFKLKTAVQEGADDDKSEEGVEDAEDAEADEGEKGGDAEESMSVGGETGCKLQVVADELLANAKDVDKALKQKTVNTVVVDIAKRATVTGSIKLCTKVQEKGWSVIVGGRSGETNDAFISDLSVGIGAGQFKCGAPCHSEHIAKYNQLLRISSGPNAPTYAGKAFRKAPGSQAKKDKVDDDEEDAV